ncbi:YncE family protein [Amycolatopsis sp. cg5]|uniref:YncE family protein n=1 Tax=Amycolatopsis sp. cg5 TaxID=3238802 RepID=UPI003525DC0B
MGVPSSVVPSGAHLWAQTGAGVTVHELDGGTTVSGPVQLAHRPVGGSGNLAVSADGKRVFALGLDGVVAELNTSTLVESKAGDTKQPSGGLAVDATGALVAVLHTTRQTVSLLDTQTKAVADIGGVLNPTSAVFSPDGATLYVLCSGVSRIVAIDTAECAVAAQVTFGRGGNLLHLSHALAIAPDGGRLFVTGNITTESGHADFLVPVGTDKLTAVDYLEYHGDGATALAVNADGRFVHSLDRRGKVVVFDTDAGKQTTTLDLNGEFTAGATDPDRTRFYLSHSGHRTVQVVDLAAAVLAPSLTVEGGAAQLAVVVSG